MIKSRLLAMIASLAGFALAVLGATGCDHATSVLPTHNRRESRLVIDDEALRFGSVFRSEQFVWPVPIENPGSEAVEVVRLRGDCQCSSITPDAFTIPPGETKVIDVASNLMGMRPEEEFRLSLTAAFADHPSEVWNIQGKVIELFADSAFPSFQLPEANSFTSELTIPLRELNAGTDSDSLSFSCQLDGTSIVWTCHENGNFPEGRHKLGVRVTAISEAGAHIETTIPVVVTKAKRYTVVPSVASFGTVTVGDSVEKIVQVRFQERCVKIEANSSCRDSQWQLARVDLSPAGDRATAVCQLRQPFEGMRFGTMECIATFKGGDTTKVLIPVSYHGITGAAEVK